jgi:MFS family permease
MLNKLSSGQKRILWVLSLINLINYLDRQVVFPLFGHIKAEFGISDFQLGLLASVFMLVHSLASLPLGILADRMSRKVIIAAGVGFWSVMSFATGLTL